MSVVFADTFFYLALLNDDDPAHERAAAESRSGRRIVTSEFILLELGNACARVEDHRDFLTLVKAMRETSRITIVPLSSELLTRAMDLMSERPDKDWSITDCTSFIIMEEEGIEEALTGDRNFEQAGFRAILR